jgi:methylated-DNA-[protein]-cysteine S-methyltransferase
VRDVIATCMRHLEGKNQDLSRIPVDLTGVPPFHREVYDASLRIPAGKTVTYGELAARLGNPGAARAVGVALSRNPIALIVPCHRVVATTEAGGGFSAYGGLATKRRLLAREGAVQRDLFD